jgi:phosphopantothenoylcysteine decarboxylase/phosphopantothenate--cysteine ligase
VGGLANDLATTLLLATDKPVIAAPAMNVRMWEHVATQRNVAQLRADGVTILEPDEGPMACGEFGAGRLPEPEAIAAAIEAALSSPYTPPSPHSVERSRSTHPSAGLSTSLRANGGGRLAGQHILVTAGPTHEPIDPVRYIANRSSGKQGFAIAAALARLGARVTLVAGPVTLHTPADVDRIDVETAYEMADAVARALPADVAVMVAAVADWHVDAVPQKIKKGDATPTLTLSENPDILATLARSPERPRLLVGFAAETETVIEHAIAKRIRKGADWIVANDVSGDVMGGASNTVHLVTQGGVESWERLPKDGVAVRLADRIADALERAP